MKTLQRCLLLSLCVGLAACSSDTFVEEQTLVESDSNATIKEISVTLPEILIDANTRTIFDMSEDGVTSTWAENDTIGIFPAKGDQVAFPTINGAGTSTATFDGGGWGLKASYAYAAYFPFNKANYFRDNKTILMDYTGQTQEGNGSAAHLGAYDYLAAGQVRPNAFGFLDLEMQRMGSIVKVEMAVPKAGTYTSVTLTSSASLFISKAELDVSGSEPQIGNKSFSSSLTLSLQNVTLEDDETLVAYFMCAPVDLTSGSLTLSLKGDASYTADITPKNLEAGKPYVFTASFEPVVGNIDFADPEVKRICVANWDTNGDGELSYAEAAAVTTLSINGMDEQAFAFNDEIVSFDELQYFTGLQKIDGGSFSFCQNLENIILPEGITEIGGLAFASADRMQGNKLKSIVIPNSVVSIGYGAFWNSPLTEVILPEGLKSIDESAFAYYREGTRALVINIPSTVTFIGRNAFYNSGITSATIPEGLTSIDYVFAGCWNLREIAIPEWVTSMEGAFSGCERLSSVEIPSSVTSIDYAFSNCSRLTSIVVPDNVSSMKYAFSGCSNLTNVNIPNSVTSIDYAFSNCSRLSSIVVPDNVSSMKYAFSYCFNLTNVNIPNNVTSIEGTFSDCSRLASVVIPTNVEDISGAFRGCSGLNNIILPENLIVIGSYAFYGCRRLESIIIPSGVKAIEAQAFSETSLESITIPENVTSIGNGAFSSNWGRMRSVTCLATNVPVLGNYAFDQTNDAPIYVPASAIEDYKFEWLDYADRIQAIPE